MQKRFAVLLLALLFVPATAAERITTDFRCLTGGQNGTIRLEWRTITDTPTNWMVAYVKYKNAKAPITLAFKSVQSIEMAKDRPSENTTTWQEIVGGKITGEYEIVTQGARVYGFRYTNARNSQVVEFAEDIAAYKDDRCQW